MNLGWFNALVFRYAYAPYRPGLSLDIIFPSSVTTYVTEKELNPRSGSLSLGLLLLPFLRGVAFWCPCMDGGNLLLQGGVDETVTGEGRFLLELRGNYYGFEHLATAA